MQAFRYVMQHGASKAHCLQAFEGIAQLVFPIPLPSQGLSLRSTAAFCPTLGCVVHCLVASGQPEMTVWSHSVTVTSFRSYCPSGAPVARRLYVLSPCFSLLVLQLCRYCLRSLLFARILGGSAWRWLVLSRLVFSR